MILTKYFNFSEKTIYIFIENINGCERERSWTGGVGCCGSNLEWIEKVRKFIN
jgi:hypothetical protein